MVKRNWSRIEDAACLYLYMKHGHRQVDKADKEVVRLAEAIGRTPSAVSYKTANFWWLDPVSRGKGFNHISKIDEEVWDIYRDDMESLQGLYSLVALGKSFASAALDQEKSIEEGDYHIPDSKGFASIRAGQEKIRMNALLLYRGKCALCVIDHPKLLVASHIVPWSADQNVRGDPRNVILLCALHDSFFDSGLISLADDYTVLVSKDLDGYSGANAAAIAVSGKKLSLPARYPPKLEYIRFHRKNVFKG